VPQAELVDWGFPVTVDDVVMMGRYPRSGRSGGPARGPPRGRGEPRAGRHGGPRDDADRRAVGRAAATGLPRPGARGRPDLFLLDEPVTGVDATTQEDLMDILEAEARAGKTVVATTHDLACAAQRFQQVATVNRTVVAHGPSSLILDPDVLARTYGGHLLVLGGRRSSSTTPTTTTTRPAGAPLPRGRVGAAGPPRAPSRDRPPAEPLTHAFFVRALIAASLVGIVCAVVGTFVVLQGPRVHRRRDQPRGVPRRRRRVHRPRPDPHRGRDRGGRSRRSRSGS
jgi:hypothetical protein